MSTKDEIDGLMSLANFRLARWSDRRKHEWAVSAGLWVFLAGVSVSDKVRIVPFFWLVILLALFVIAHAWLWVRWIWTRNRRDLGQAFVYSGKAHYLLLGDEQIGAPAPSWLHTWIKRRYPRIFSHVEFLTEGICAFEVTVTALLAAAVIVIRCG